MKADLIAQAEANRKLARQIRLLALDLDADWESLRHLIEYARELEEEASLLSILASRE